MRRQCFVPFSIIAGTAVTAASRCEPVKPALSRSGGGGTAGPKAGSAARRVIPVAARDTSRPCPEYGHVAQENRPTQEKFECTRCGFLANADHVGALNVLNRAGLVLCAEV
ncbi:zinc ribbon domain-containing protein [Streptomyces sp. NPDC001970]